MRAGNRVRSAVWVILVLTQLALTVSAAEYKAGDAVVVINDAHITTPEGNVGNKVWPGFVLMVRSQEGEKLKFASSNGGWISAADVIPVNRAAVERLTALLVDAPKNADLFGGRAAVRDRVGDLKGAMEDYDEAIRLHPSAMNYNNRGFSWQGVHGDFDRAISDYNQALRVDPNMAVAYNNRGLAWMVKGELDKALADFQEALRIDATNVGALNSRGLLWVNRGEPKKALGDFSEAIRLDSLFARAYSNRGIVRLSLSDHEGALADFNTALRLNPREILAYMNRGMLFLRSGEHDKALADFNEALRLNPRDAPTYSNRSYVWLQKNEFDKAVADATEAIRLDAKFTPAYEHRGNALVEKAEYEKACADFDVVLKLVPKPIAGYLGRGNAWSGLGDYNRAIADYTEALRLSPNDTSAYTFRGLAQQAKGEFEKGVVDLDRALQLDPKHELARYRWAVAKLVQRAPEACDGFQAVLENEGWQGERAAYAVIFGNLAARLVSDQDRAKKFLLEAEGKLNEEWPLPALKFLRQELDAAELTKLATDNPKQCDVHCILGFDDLLQGKNAEAAPHFRWVKEHATKGKALHIIAIAECERLDRAAKAPAP